ncbi:MAG: TolC family protein [Magnetococcales bacterium]|nr:TolC family protein [Magnetococcales bacterium]
MKRFFSWLLLAITSIAPAMACDNTPPTRPLTLAQVMDRALCNDGSSREAWASVRTQREQLAIAQAPFLPTVTGQANWNRRDSSTQKASSMLDYPYQQHTIGLNLTYLLYDFGNRQATLDQARYLLDALQFSHNTTIQQLMHTSVQYYYQLLARQALVAATQEAERVSQRSVDAAQLRYQVGRGVLADVLQARTALSQAKLNRVRAEGEWQQRQGQLATLMGLAVTTPFELVVPNDQSDQDNPNGTAKALIQQVEVLIEQARQQRPDLAAAEAQYHAAGAAVAAARSADYPTLSLNVSADRQQIGGDHNLNNVIGVAVNVPIFSGFAPIHRTRHALIQQEKQEIAWQDLQKQAALEVWQAWHEIKTAGQAVATGRELLLQAQQSLQVAEGRYRAGVGQILDLLNAQNALASAQQQLIQSSYDWRVARITLARAMGQLDRSVEE